MHSPAGSEASGRSAISTPRQRANSLSKALVCAVVVQVEGSISIPAEITACAVRHTTNLTVTMLSIEDPLLPLPPASPADRDTEIPLLSVPPNVTFSAGLTAEHVADGAPLWAGQARRRRIIDDAKASAAASATGADGGGGGGGAGSVEKEPEDLPPPPRIGGAPKAAHKPSGQQRMQVSKNASNRFFCRAFFCVDPTAFVIGREGRGGGGRRRKLSEQQRGRFYLFFW